ncbi:probable L-type lectin-domain containing receptor kinase S.5 [Actinidia eriantha]|uniref:probable L-type lectin-domain containing receptor kinase S.5 n=1 Tax=Actinidia eriantha TaxID=165200 RepID=UPI002590C3E4|nr:probable L-type lectin-domain containing receptor kinase S.5 [Actinidia eriantha]
MGDIGGFSQQFNAKWEVDYEYGQGCTIQRRGMEERDGHDKSETNLSVAGWCYKNGKLLIVYDYMPNGSLDKHLFHEADSKPFSWTLRYKIISGLAAALHYLHNEYDQRVVHRDLKASNMMLYSNFNAKLSNFGLARALDNEKNSYAEAE